MGTVDASSMPAAQALHVSNLPWDATPRDLYWLYTTMPGYLSGILKYDSAGGRHPIAFITFDSQQNAEVAMHASNGLPWAGGEPEGQRLRVALAKEVSKGQMRTDGAISVTGQPPTAATTIPQPYPGMPGAAARFAPYPGAPAPGYPPGYPPGTAEQHAAWSAAAAYDPASYGAAQALQSTKNAGTPSTTLFVRCGRPAPYEFNSQMIESLFMRQAPLPQKVSVRGGRAWVKYATIEEATTALPIYQGYLGPETDGSAIEISFARAETKA
eukprot:Hpha_TRINITY_DN12873_c0_g2::TRINITY_DN12873_c0_g2_i1::g.24324::m.24324